jgi:hypothetical protein
MSAWAHRVISLRCGIWSLSGIADIDQAAPIKLDLWLGEERRAGAGVFKAGPLHQECLAQTPFADIRVLEIHKTHIWTADSIVGYLYSTSFASRAVLGNLRKSFENDLRERLSRLSAEDRFAEEIEFSIVSARAIV